MSAFYGLLAFDALAVILGAHAAARGVLIVKRETPATEAKRKQD